MGAFHLLAQSTAIGAKPRIVDRHRANEHVLRDARGPETSNPPLLVQHIEDVVVPSLALVAVLQSVPVLAQSVPTD